MMWLDALSPHWLVIHNSNPTVGGGHIRRDDSGLHEQQMATIRNLAAAFIIRVQANGGQMSERS